jgi:hypothetical protein
MLYLYSEALGAAGFEVQQAGALEQVPLRCADVAIVQLHPRDDASRVGRALRSRTECGLLIALVAFHLKAEPGTFDEVALIPLAPAELATIICSRVACGGVPLPLHTADS